MGVIQYVSYQPHIVNPLSVVANERKKRLVLDARSSGLNDVIISPKFALPNLGGIVQTLHSNDFMLKLDLANGFLQLPIQKQEHRYLGFRNPIDGRFGVFTRLSFGLRSAPFLFSTFTHALKQATKQILDIDAQVYIDDWFIAQHSEAELTNTGKRFCDFLHYLGVTIQHEKTEGPARSITYLGLIVDTSEHKILLPETKRIKYLQGVNELLEETTPTMSQVAKTAGRLVHIAFVHRAGAAQIQPLWEVLYRDKAVWTKRELEQEELTIDMELRACLQWWKEILEIPHLQRKVWVSPANQLFLWSHDSATALAQFSKTICTDASNAGWGASTGRLTKTGIWSNKQKRTSNNWKELKAVNLSIEAWEFIRNMPILILTDSSTVVAALRKRNSQAQPLKMILNELSLIEKDRNIEVVAIHLPGILNDLPDRLSRRTPVADATYLIFNRDLFPDAVANITQLCGMQWLQDKRGASMFSRCHQIFVEPQPLLIAISTPDIPFLKRQIPTLHNHKERVFILIPKIPTAELPIPQTTTVTVESNLRCLNAPQTEWTLLEVIRSGGINVRNANNP